MQHKLSHILTITLAFVGLIVYSAQAQEAIQNETQEKEIKELSSHPELNLEDDKTLIYESEQQKPINQPASKESVSPVKSSKPKSDKTTAEKEEDALSFNFLYYIFQKFKYSDIVD